MNEIVIGSKQLPDTINDLMEFDRQYSVRKQAYEKLLNLVSDWETATEEEKRILRRGQDEAEHLIDIRAKIGLLTSRMEKAENQYSASNNGVTSKSKQLEEIGLTKMQASRYETLAKPENQEIIERVKAEARRNNELVTQTEILREITAERKQVLCGCDPYEEQAYETAYGFDVISKKPHVSNNSRDDNEWYTPVEYLESARRVLGTINLDPASNDFANERVQAEMYYTEDDDGLNQDWYGNIWLNPPYSSDSVKPFAEKLVNSDFDEAIVLVNNATETEWFNLLISKASAIVFPKGRIQFDKRDGKHGSPLQGQAFIYYGDDADKFLSEFMKYGWGAKL